MTDLKTMNLFNDITNNTQQDKMIIYHGSDRVVKVPRFVVGNSYNDYGQGFYCTEDKHEADLWASTRGVGYTNKYSLDISNLKPCI